MTLKPRILAFAGSLRKDSCNKKLVRIALKGAEEAGAEVTYIDLADYPMPIYNQDDEDRDGLPENAVKLKRLMREHHGFLISAPEYNSSLSAAFKNAIDWTSRKEQKDEPNLECYAGKTAAIMSASPGALGGLRGLVHVRAMLENIQVLVLPHQQTVPSAYDAFDEEGNLKEPKKAQAVMDLGRRLTETIRSLNA